MPRELIDTGTDKRYVRRDEDGKFKESDDVGRSSAADQRQHSKTTPRRGANWFHFLNDVDRPGKPSSPGKMRPAGAFG